MSVAGRFGGWSGVGAAVLVLGLAAAASAGDWRDLAAGADRIVVATPIHQTSRWEGDGIYTYTDVAIRRVARGPIENTLTLRQPGGVVGRIGQKVTHLERVVPGRSYLLFLRSSEGGLWDPGDRGALPILDEAGAEKVAGQALETVMRTLEVAR